MGHRDLTRAFRHRPFLLLWFGQSISSFGNAFHTIALAWWVMRETGSGLAMGTVLICNLIPQVPLGPAAAIEKRRGRPSFGGCVIDDGAATPAHVSL